MMADHWLFVLAAYGLAAAVVAAYWWHLVRRERELSREGAISPVSYSTREPRR